METRKISKLTGAFVAVASCVAMFGLGGALTSTAHADTYTTKDNFIAGDLQTNVPVNLNITKYKQGAQGVNPTGSANDAAKIGADAMPVQGVDFTLFEVSVDTANNCKATDLLITAQNPGTTTAPTVKCGIVNPTPYGTKTTDGNGQTSFTWPSLSAVKYYVLQESKGPAQGGVVLSQDSLFGLPFYTTNHVDATNTDQTGYVYNVSVFPKNVSSSQISKSVSGPAVVQAGNTLTYNIGQRIYNKANKDVPTGVTPTPDPTKPGDGYLDYSEINSTATTPIQPQVRIVDRLSSALSIQGSPAVSWSCVDASNNPLTGTLAAGTDYVASTTANDPQRLTGNGGGPVFQDKISGAGNNYVTVDLWTDGASPATNTAAAKFLTATANCSTGLTIHVQLKAQVTTSGDGTSAPVGSVQNTAAVDVFDGTKAPVIPGGDASVKSASAGFQFAKTDETSAKAVPNAVFRLVKPGTSAYLLQDGTFTSTTNQPSATNPYFNATSNSAGVVNFVGLPLFKAADYDSTGQLKPTTPTDSQWLTDTTLGSGGKLDLVEVVTPTGFTNPGVSFGTVDFSKYIGQTANQISALGSVTPADYSGIFGQQYTADASIVSTNFADSTGAKISIGLKNFAHPPIGLPLTGGQGILIFLIAGAAVMGITLFVRSRRNKANMTA